LLLEPALLTVQHALQANLVQEPQMTLHLAIGVAATTDGQKIDRACNFCDSFAVARAVVGA